MELLTLITVLIIVVPFQIVFFMCLFWFKNKFDKYENIALVIINNYTSHDKNYSRNDIEQMLIYYNKCANEMSEYGYKTLNESSSTELIVNSYKKIITDIRKIKQKYIIDSSISAIANTLHNRYSGSKSVSGIITGLNDKIGLFDNELLKENPFISIAVDLLSVAWVFLTEKNIN